MTTTLIRPDPVTVPDRDAAYDLSAGRCAIDAVIAPFGVPVWRARLRAVAIRLSDRGCGRQWLVANVAVQPRFASLPFTTSWFMPSTPRSHLLTFTAELPALESGSAVSVDGSASVGDRNWPVALDVRCIRSDAGRVVIAVSGSVARRDKLPFPSLRLRVDAAAELVRCE